MFARGSKCWQGSFPSQRRSSGNPLLSRPARLLGNRLLRLQPRCPGSRRIPPNSLRRSGIRARVRCLLLERSKPRRWRAASTPPAKPCPLKKGNEISWLRRNSVGVGWAVYSLLSDKDPRNRQWEKIMKPTTQGNVLFFQEVWKLTTFILVSGLIKLGGAGLKLYEEANRLSPAALVAASVFFSFLFFFLILNSLTSQGWKQRWWLFSFQVCMAWNWMHSCLWLSIDGKYVWRDWR